MACLSRRDGPEDGGAEVDRDRQELPVGNVAAAVAVRARYDGTRCASAMRVLHRRLQYRIEVQLLPGIMKVVVVSLGALIEIEWICMLLTVRL